MATQSYAGLKRRAGRAKRNWISSAIKRPGALHRSMGVAQGKNIPQDKIRAAAKKGGKIGQRARLALTLAKFRKKRSRRPAD